MRIKDDMIAPLVGEILNDVATSFFDARRRIEAKIDLFHKYVDELRKMATNVQSHAALLNLLLVDDRQAKAFYQLLGLDGDVFVAAKGVDPRDDLSRFPFAIGFRRRYTKLVFTAYAHLQEACALYANGPQSLSDKTPSLPNQEFIYYGLIVKMHQVINEDIKRINDTISPSCTLQFAKGFKPDVMAKERVTGGGISNAKSLDDKLCYRPIDLQSLSLTAFPRLPNLGDVRSSISRFCRDLCNRYPDELEKIVEFIRHRVSAK